MILAIAFLSAGASWGADAITPFDVKLGLWETKASTQMGAMRNMPAMPSIPPDALANMTPEQRAHVEAMMKARAGGPMVTTTKICITREQLNNPMAFSRPDRTSTPKVVSSSATRQQIHVECTHQGGKVAGDLTVERIDSEHIKGNMAMKGGMEGHPVDIKMTFDTTWVASDCGNVKPPNAR